MVKSFVAMTNEVDDAKVAVDEILSQLDLGGKNELGSNSVGIISCFAEYVSEGIVEALNAALPFELIGITTIANSAMDEISETMLSILVLTSDDVSFATVLSDHIADENVSVLRSCYEEGIKKLPGKPSAMLSFVPLLTNMGGDFYIDSMSEISGGIPNFGTLAVDHNADYHDSQVLLNSTASRDQLAILLIYGEVEPTFYVGAISKDKVFRDKGVVTASKGNQLQSVDGMSIRKYLLSLGLEEGEDGSIAGINTFPIIVDFNDGSVPVVRAMFAITPEGYAVCGGSIPVGATISIGCFDPDEILETTERTVESALSDKSHSTFLIYSCIGRYFAQGYDQTAEMNHIMQNFEGKDLNYTVTYSGGEFCPVEREGKNLVNRHHNNTIVIMAL